MLFGVMVNGNISSISLTPRHIFRENHNSKGGMHSGVHCSTIYNSHAWKQPKRPLAKEWIKMWYLYKMKYFCCSVAKSCPTLCGL